MDDAPYGGGAGMVMQAAPVCDAYEDLCGRLGKRPRVHLHDAPGKVFNQKIAQELAQEEDLVFLCGHYEGIDERALERDRHGLSVHRRLCAHRRRAAGHGDDRLHLPAGAGGAK